MRLSLCSHTLGDWKAGFFVGINCMYVKCRYMQYLYTHPLKKQ